LRLARLLTAEHERLIEAARQLLWPSPDCRSCGGDRTRAALFADLLPVSVLREPA
jgi:hypothetical protein